MSNNLPTIPEAISSLGHLRYLAKHSANGVMTGIHRSGWFGSSIEFAEHKSYSPGDDLRHIDWKALGRADKLYIKRFEDETNLKAYLVLDHSSSMNFGTVGYTKFDYGRVLAASLSYLFVQQHDWVGLLSFGKNDFMYIPPRGRMGHFQYVTEELFTLKPRGEKKLSQALEDLLKKTKKRSVIVVISDFLTDLHSIQSLARLFRAGSHEVIWAHLLDPAELDFPYDDWTQFRGLESEGEVLAHGRAAAKGYKKEILAWQSELKDLALQNHISYRLVRTDLPLDQTLSLLLL